MNLHDFKVRDIAGNQFDFAALKGKKVMLVNTASACGLTPQYSALEDLYKNFKDKNFVIIGFPCNDFGAQEPGTESEIAEFCERNYGVSFPMMSKIKVKGADKHPLYSWLLDESSKRNLGDQIKWNFQKFLIDEKGEFINNIEPTTLPNDDLVLNWLANE